MKLAIAAFAAVCAFAQFPASTIGEQRTMAVVVTFADVPQTQCPFTAAQLATAVFGAQPEALNGWYRKVTGGRIWLTGDAFECVTLPTRLFHCPDHIGDTTLPDINTAVGEALAARGVDLERYNRRILAMAAFPCPWAGLGALGAGNTTPGGTQYSVMWVKCSANPLNTAFPVACATHHEFGHNLGMAHAWCRNISSEYCDKTDTMGGCGLCGFNAPHWLQMGWGRAIPVESGTFTVGTLEATGDVLSVGSYYVSYRSEFGHAYIHTRSPWLETLLVDTTPETSYTVDAQLTIGRTFSEAGLYITLLEKTETSATFSIQTSAPPPAPPPALPPIAISPVSVTLSTAPQSKQQFTANQPVVWSVVGPGQISTNGLYDPPNNLRQQTTATVFACNPSSCANATVVLQPRK